MLRKNLFTGRWSSLSGASPSGCEGRRFETRGDWFCCSHYSDGRNLWVHHKDGECGPGPRIKSGV